MKTLTASSVAKTEKTKNLIFNAICHGCEKMKPSFHVVRFSTREIHTCEGCF